MNSKYFIRGAYYLTTQLLTRAYHQGIHVNSQEVLRLREVAQEASRKRQSIVFLPCHRSHVDYLSLQVVCYRLGLVLPTVVAGDNLNFPVVGSFLQHAGAMYIRRSFGDDQLYTTLVQAYIDTLLQTGLNLECFIEGGRSRTGKLLQPKFGILGFILESVMSGSVDDCLICPVSTQYDKVIEVDSYVSELLGTPKKKEDLAGFLSASNVLSLKLGRVDVRFHKPWSLREYIADQSSRLPQAIGSEGVPYSVMKQRILVTFGYQVLSDINTASVVMPTALVGTVLLTLTGKSVGRAELVRRVNWLSSRVNAQGGRIAHFAGNTPESVVDKALEVLGPALVGRIDGLSEQLYYAEDRFQLSFYRNMTIHLFISQALVCAALYTKLKLAQGPDSESMTFKELYDYVLFLSQLFRAEFIFATTPLGENLRNTLLGLEKDNVLSITRSADGTNVIESVSVHDEERALNLENFDFYCYLIWPFIEASWLGNMSLFMLCPPAADLDQQAWLDLNSMQNKAQLLGKTLYHRGDLTYYEAVNKETLKNAVSHCEEEGIISVTRPTKGSGNTKPLVRLAPQWMPKRDGTAEARLLPQGKLWDLCEHINRSRRAGDSRQDTAAARARLLRLVETTAEDLFAQATVNPKAKSRKSWRRQGIQPKGKL